MSSLKLVGVILLCGGGEVKGVSLFKDLSTYSGGGTSITVLAEITNSP